MSLSPEEQAGVAALLASRVQPEPTGDAVAARILAAVAKIRDDVCACTTDACFDGLDDKLAGAGSLSETAPERARLFATELIDDISSCQERYRHSKSPFAADTSR